MLYTDKAKKELKNIKLATKTVQKWVLKDTDMVKGVITLSHITGVETRVLLTVVLAVLSKMLVDGKIMLCKRDGGV